VAELKTRPTDSDVEAFLARVEPATKQADCRALVALMAEATGERPRMWGSSMVGFGDYHYRYASGREGDWFLAGFSPRKANLTVYLSGGIDSHRELLAGLGPHTTGVGCLYLKRLGDVDTDVLAEIVRRDVAQLRAGAS